MATKLAGGCWEQKRTSHRDANNVATASDLIRFPDRQMPTNRSFSAHLCCRHRAGAVGNVMDANRPRGFTLQNKSPEFGSLGRILKKSDLRAAHEHRDQSNQRRAAEPHPGRGRLSLFVKICPLIFGRKLWATNSFLMMVTELFILLSPPFHHPSCVGSVRQPPPLSPSVSVCRAALLTRRPSPLRAESKPRWRSSICCHFSLKRYESVLTPCNW